LEALEKDKKRLEEELTAAKEKLSRAQMDGGEAMVKAEQEIANLKKENSSLRDEIATINQNLLYFFIEKKLKYSEKYWDDVKMVLNGASTDNLDTMLLKDIKLEQITD
jgi:predicted  nucleic acid-binding Zn-ribbon protein